MSDWIAGYRAALDDFEKLSAHRFAEFPARFRAASNALLSDLRVDADTIDHEALNRSQRASLRAERAARQSKQAALL